MVTTVSMRRVRIYSLLRIRKEVIDIKREARQRNWIRVYMSEWDIYVYAQIQHTRRNKDRNRLTGRYVISLLLFKMRFYKRPLIHKPNKPPNDLQESI